MKEDQWTASSASQRASLPERDGVRQRLRVGPATEEACGSSQQTHSLQPQLGQQLVKGGANDIGTLLAGEVATSAKSALGPSIP